MAQQDKITDDVLARIVRNQDPEFYANWSDEAIVSNTLYNFPSLKQDVRMRSPGEKLYDSIGDDAAPGFLDRSAFQMENMLRTASAGLKGMVNPQDAQIGENARKLADRIYRDRISANPDLQALVAWKENEPGWTSFDASLRSLSEAIPSLALSAVGAVGASFLAPALGTGAVATVGAGILGMAPIGILEGTSMYVDMMKTLVDDEGLSPEEAQDNAYVAAALYTPTSMLFEYLGGKAFAKVGGIGEEAFNADLRKTLAKSVVNSKSGVSRIKELGARGVVSIADGLSTTVSEGLTEFAQATTQQVIQNGIRNQVADDELGVLEAYQKAFQESWLDKQALEEGYAGATTGMLSIFRLTNKVGMNLIGSDVTTEDISDVTAEKRAVIEDVRRDELTSLSKEKLKQIASELQIPGRTNLAKAQGKEPLVNAILNAEKETTETPQQQTVDTPLETEEAQTIDKDDTDLEARYLDALTDTDNMQDVLDESVNRGDNVSKAIQDANSKKGLGAKILGLVISSPNKNDIISKVKNSNNNEILLDAVREEINNTIKNDTGLSNRQKKELNLPKNSTESQIISGLSNFAKTGSVKEITPDVEFDTDDTSQFVYGEYEPEVELTQANVQQKAETPQPTDTKFGDPELGGDIQIGGMTVSAKPTDRAGEKVPDAPVQKEVIQEEETTSLQERMTKKIAEVAKGSAIKYIPKEQVKTKIATQFIGQGVKNSSTDRYQKMYAEEGLANTGNYTSDDIIFIASNGRRSGAFQAVVNGVLQGAYKNIDKAMEAGATIVMDTAAHLKAKGGYLKGEVDLAKYLEDNGYSRVGTSGQWVPAKQEVAPKQETVEKPTTLTDGVEKGSSAKMSQGAIDVLKDKTKKTTVGDRKTFAKLFRTQRDVEKDGGRVYIEGETANQYRLQAQDNKGDKIGGVFTVPKTLAGVPTLDITKPKTVDDLFDFGDKPKKEEKEESFVDKVRDLADDLGKAIIKAVPSRKPKTKKALKNYDYGRVLVKFINDYNAGKLTPKQREFYEKTILPQIEITEESIAEDIEAAVIKGTSPLGVKRKEALKKAKELLEKPTQVSNKVKLGFNKTTKSIVAQVNNVTYDLNNEEQIESKKLQKRAKALEKNPTKIAQEKFDADRKAWEEGILARVQGMVDAELNPVKPTDEEIDNKRSLDRTNNDDLNFSFQDDKSSQEILITEDKKLADKILSRLKKHFPFVDTKTFQGVLTLYGKRRIGFAMERLAAWSSTDARMDTMPHEYAHIYVKLFRNDPLVKQGIKKFETEENLVKYIGLYYTNRARNTSLGKRIKIWLKQFANRLKRFFGKDVSNIEKFIAEEFYQGRMLGAEAIVGDQFIDFMDDKSQQDDAVSGEEKSTDATNVTTDHHITQFYKDALGIYLDKYEHYPEMIKLAKTTKSFDEYLIKLSQWAKNIADNRALLIQGKPEKARNVAEKTTNALGQEVYKLQQENPYLFNELAMDWLKGLDKLSRFNTEDSRSQTADARIYQMWTIDGMSDNSKGDGIRLAGSNSRITNKKYPQNVVKNFFEKQKDKLSRLLFLPVKEISKTNVRKKDNVRFWTRANAKFNVGQLLQLEADYTSQYINQIEDLFSLSSDSSATDQKVNKIQDAWMSAIVGSKLGDNASVISTFIPKQYRPLNLTLDSYKEFFDNEKKFGNINESHKKEFMSNLEKAERSTNPLVNNTIDEFIENNKDLNRSEIGLEIKRYATQAIRLKAELSSNIGRYIAWQELRTPDYLIHEKSVADSMTRLSIDLAEGFQPRGLGDSTAMVIADNTKVEVMYDGEYVDAGVYEDMDGATLTAGSWFKKIKKILGGTDRIVQLKTFIRQRDVNADGSANYIAFKHMQFSPHNNIRFSNPETGEMIAEYQGSGLNGIFVDANGNKFDMIASPNEAKMRFGKEYSEDNKIITISEDSIKVHDVQRGSKKDASHPIALGEMLMASMSQSKEAKDLIKAIKEHYNNVSNHYIQEIQSIFKDSSNFKKFINTEVKAGRVPTEILKYVSLIKDDGKGIFHPAIMSQIIPIINSKFVRNGLFKSRATNESASKVYLKPSAHLDIKEGNVMLSSDNFVAIRQVENAYKKANNITGSIKKYYESLGIKPKEKHKRIKLLNEFLENNEVNVLVHRNPIQKVTGVVVRRVQRIHDGFHGETMFMSKEDVKNVLDGDWDGDTAQFEFISDKYASAVKKWQNSSEYKKVNKIVSVDIFASRTDKPRFDNDGNEIKTSVASKEDIYNAISENAKLDGTTGFFTNAKIIMGQLFAKDFKLFHGDLKADEQYIRVKDPNATVVMDYYPLDKNNLKRDNNKLYNEILQNGDNIVDSKGNVVDLSFDDAVYLQTTVNHEISTLFQMAVDSGKYDVLGKILDESNIPAFDFMLTRIFEIANKDGSVSNKKLYDPNNIGQQSASKMTAMLSLVYAGQNISKRRAGTNLDNAAGRAASFDRNVSQSIQLNDRHFDENGKLSKSQDYADKFREDMSYKDSNKTNPKYNPKRHGEFYGNRLTMKNIISPAEELMLSLGQKMKDIEFYQISRNVGAKRNAHTLAMEELIDNATNFPFWGDFIVGKNKKDYVAAHEFLYGKKEFNGESSNFKDSWMALKQKLGKQGKTENVQSDLNDSVIAFTERFQEQWNKLSENSQIWATFRMLRGFDNDVHVLKLPPLSLMNDKVMAQYLPMFENNLRKQTFQGIEQTAQKSRQEKEYFKIVKNIVKTYQKYDEVKNIDVCLVNS